MNYTIKAHPTLYADVWFRSRLEATWAAFFGLADWAWLYEPIDLEGWTPDFRVEFRCGHSNCQPTHKLLVSVKPFFSFGEFKEDPQSAQLDIFHFGSRFPDVDAYAWFGIAPSVSFWSMIHETNWNPFHVPEWIPNWKELWAKAGNITRWHPSNN